MRVGSHTRTQGGTLWATYGSPLTDGEQEAHWKAVFHGTFVGDEELCAGELEELDRVRRFDPRYDRWAA